MQISGAKLFVKALAAEGVDTVFGYPGGYAIDLFDELYKQDNAKIKLILPRHEQGLIHAADGYARSSGRTGVCLVTSGPGATNLVTGIATANYDSVPLVCFTGQVSTGLIGNDAFQEVDIIGITRNICKWGVTVHRREDLGRIIKEAFYIANTGKPGPVIIDIPKDIQTSLGPSEYPSEVNIRGYKPIENVHIGQLKKAYRMLKSAKRPLILAGGGVTRREAFEMFTKFAEQTKTPVVTTLMGRGSIPTTHSLFVGNCGMHGTYAANMAVSQCDILFSIGTRFNDRITGDLNEFAPEAKIVHIDIDTASISRNVKVDVPVVSDAFTALSKLTEWAEGDAEKLEHIEGREEWIDKIQSWNQENPLEMKVENGVSPQAVIEAINQSYDHYQVVTDVGQNQMWTYQFLQMDENRRLITSGGLGTMGYGLPGAIGAKLANPEENIISVNGDGGIQMNIQELATAVIEGLPITVCIFNNGYLGMVRQMQHLFYGKRYSATCLTKRRSCPEDCKGPGEQCPAYTPDFVKLAESYECRGIRVTKNEEILPALKAAREETKVPTIIEFMIPYGELVLPMVKGGNPMSEMILKAKK